MSPSEPDHAERGEPVPALQEVFPTMYEELRVLADRFFAGQPINHTLQPTALVSELYLRLARGKQEFTDRTHFMAVAASAMRQLLVDHARTRRRLKRGAGQPKLQLHDESAIELGTLAISDLLDLDDAISALHDMNPRHARVVELRFFGGLRPAEIADVLGVAKTTVDNDWRAAKAWLGAQLRK